MPLQRPRAGGMHQRRNNAFEAVAENWNPRNSGKTTENPQLPFRGPSDGREKATVATLFGQRH